MQKQTGAAQVGILWLARDKEKRVGMFCGGNVAAHIDLRSEATPQPLNSGRWIIWEIFQREFMRFFLWINLMQEVWCSFEL